MGQLFRNTRIIFFYSIDSSSFIRAKDLRHVSRMVFVNKTENQAPMFYGKIYRSVLFELLRGYTRQFIKILLNGEQFPGEYKSCKDSLEMIQKQLKWEEKRSVRR